MRLAISASLFLAVMVAGCAHQIAAYPLQPRMMQSCELERVVFHFQWVDDVDQVARACNGGKHLTYGCARRWVAPDGEVHAYLVMTRPKSFNDEPVLAVLGHEVCHGAGGMHE